MTVDQKIDRALARLDRELLEAATERRLLERRLVDLFKKAMVPGRTIRWKHGSSIRSGTVVEPPDNWCWPGKVLVRSAASGKSFHISCHDAMSMLKV